MHTIIQTPNLIKMIMTYANPALREMGAIFLRSDKFTELG